MAYGRITEGESAGKPQVFRVEDSMFQRLVDRGVLTGVELEEISRISRSPAEQVERLLLTKGIPKHHILHCLSSHYRLPFIEYDEKLTVPENLSAQVDFNELKKRLWCPLGVRAGTAKVVIFNPADGSLLEEIKRILRVDTLKLVVALPSDIIRILENSGDINPGFPDSAGRTRLAKLRTWLANERVLLAQYRTTLSKGRTGLAFIRTGVAFISIGLVLLRIFGIGFLTILEALLIVGGVIMAVDGVYWYLPARKIDKNRIDYAGTEPTFGTTILQLGYSGETPTFSRTPPVKGAEKLRSLWNRLSPVMKRRFLAIDRTDLAEERTILANYRTRMARARTGLAFTRTGVSFIGLGIGLFRQFHAGPWSLFDALLILSGALMVLEGFHWYVPGRKAGDESFKAVQNMRNRTSIWEFMFPPLHRQVNSDHPSPPLFLNRDHALGIWGTTGLALERTLIADRRNVKSRLRTIMARSRTGMAFIRTGSSIFSVGMVLLVYFGLGSTIWTLCNLVLLVIGLAFIADGLYWHIPAERMKEEFSYCLGDMEIVFVDYAKPSTTWRKVEFSHDDL